MMTKYKCPLCNFTAKTVSAVKQHVKEIHSKEISEKCPVCGYKFRPYSRSSSIIIHMYQVFHNKNDPQHALFYWILSNANSLARRHTFRNITEGKKLKQMLIVQE